MFQQGFLFFWGIAAGCFVFCLMLMGVLVAIDTVRRLFERQRSMDGTIDIRQWQEQKIVAKSIRGHSPERRA